MCRHNVQLSVQWCTIEGMLHTTSQAQGQAWKVDNEIGLPKHHVGVPPEQGAFEFVPNKYNRKQ